MNTMVWKMEKTTYMASRCAPMRRPTWSHADTGFTLGVAPTASTRPLHTGLRSELGLPWVAI